MEKSIWSENVVLPEFEELDGDKKTEVLIIGGGICGLLCGYYLKQAGVDCIVAEGSKIASGTTKNSTAKITSQHGLLYSELQRKYGREYAGKYLAANQWAIEEYAQIGKKFDCDFKRKTAFTYSLCSREKIEDEVGAVNDLGCLKAEFHEKTELPFETKGAVAFRNQAQLNPLKLAAGIAKELNVYENTFMREVKPFEAVTDKGRIKAKEIIVATHFPFINKHGSYFLKLYQHRTYVCAFENAPGVEGMYVDEAKEGMSFRTSGEYLLIGGSGHRTGKKSGAWETVRDFADRFYPEAKEKFRWAAQDCMSLDGVPYIGKYSKNTPDLYVATGFNKWGFTSSMVAARLLCDKILGKENEYEDVFSPQRSILKPQLLVNGFESAMNLATLKKPRCPHLGCALKWNKNEHTWDCPCHGSRFESDGKLIDNPATKDAKI